MADNDIFVCPNGHVNNFYTGERNHETDENGPTPKVWYEDSQGNRSLGERFQPMVEEGAVCGKPKEAHAPRAELMQPTSCGRLPQNHADRDHEYMSGQQGNQVTPETAAGPCVWHSAMGFEEQGHAYIGDGTEPCQHPVGMKRLIGYLCLECGAPIEDMPQPVKG